MTRSRLPLLRPGSVPRHALVERLAACPEPVIAICAPAGYGKSTLLRQWSDRETDVAYHRLDAADDDPAALLAHLVAALRRAGAIDEAQARSIAASRSTIAVTVLDRLIGALEASTRPLLLMLDDTHQLRSRPGRDALGWLVDRSPPGMRIVLAGRTDFGPPLPRLRAEGRVAEVGSADLALDAAEIRALAALEGVELTHADAIALRETTEGWPVAAYLAVRARRSDEAAGRPPRPYRGSEHAIGDYMRSELVDALDPETQQWITRAAVLETLTGPACDRVTGMTGSLRRLRALQRGNQLVSPLDDEDASFRFHHLFRELLLDELEVREPGAASRLGIEAARWYAEQGDPVAAVRHAHLAGDLGAVAALIERHAVTLLQRGYLETLGRWLEWFDRDGLRDRHAGVAVIATWLEALRGRTAAAMTWLDAAERAHHAGPMADGTLDKGPWVAGIRAFMMPAGVDTFLTDAEHASRGLSPSGPWVGVAVLLPLVGAVVTGDLEAADVIAAQAFDVVSARGANPGLTVLLAQRASIALGRNDLAAASDLVRQGLETIERMRLDDYVTSGHLFAVAARVAIAEGRVGAARAHITAVNRLRPRMTAAVPWAAVQMRIDAIRACIALDQAGAARALLSEIDEVTSIRPDLGALNQQIAAVRSAVDAIRSHTAGPWTLTSAEIRLLAYLPTHLTFREIAERMHLSPHTVKTQAMSIYGKLEASSRREALERAVEVGLLDASVLRITDGAGRVA